MQSVTLDDVDLEYEVRGSGEPLLLIHGSILADGFFPLLSEPRLADHYRLISFHRRGFAGSSRARAPFTLAQQGADARALLRHLGISRAHVAGHSYGAAIAMQLTVDALTEVHSLTLLEPPLFAETPSGATFWDGIASIRQNLFERGDKAGAVDAFLTAVVGADYRRIIDRSLPAGAFDLAVADLDTFFAVELPALQQWRFTSEDAVRIRQPVLSMVGSETSPLFSEGHAWLMQWLPQVEELVVPQATHALQQMNPAAVADGLARFLARHPLR